MLRINIIARLIDSVWWKMKKCFTFIIVLLLVSLCGCSRRADVDYNNYEFGAFLGANAEDLDELLKYKEVAIDIDEFDSDSIARLKENGTIIDAYLSVGALENYRDYYDEFKTLTFMDYENWPMERWIDVSDVGWQNKLYSEAQRFKRLGADNLFLDNYDVYYIATSEYDGGSGFDERIFSGLKAVTEALHSLELGLLINSGTDFLERLHEENDDTIKLFEGYIQECVFSSIIDYESDVFGKSEGEDYRYYLSIIDIMKEDSQVYLLEYTTDDALSAKIKEFCDDNGYKYYISSHVGLY